MICRSARHNSLSHVLMCAHRTLKHAGDEYSGIAESEITTTYNTTNLAQYKNTDAEQEGENTTPIRGPDSVAHSPDYAHVS